MKKLLTKNSTLRHPLGRAFNRPHPEFAPVHALVEHDPEAKAALDLRIKVAAYERDKLHVRELVREFFGDWNPVLAMCAIANDETRPIELRFAACKEVAKYLEPRRRTEFYAPNNPDL